MRRTLTLLSLLLLASVSLAAAQLPTGKVDSVVFDGQEAAAFARVTLPEGGEWEASRVVVRFCLQTRTAGKQNPCVYRYGTADWVPRRPLPAAEILEVAVHFTPSESPR